MASSSKPRMGAVARWQSQLTLRIQDIVRQVDDLWSEASSSMCALEQQHNRFAAFVADENGPLTAPTEAVAAELYDARSAYFDWRKLLRYRPAEWYHQNVTDDSEEAATPREIPSQFVTAARVVPVLREAVAMLRDSYAALERAQNSLIAVQEAIDDEIIIEPVDRSLGAVEDAIRAIAGEIAVIEEGCREVHA